jgi:DNA (cytosine-5)-methyltransferase 1
MNIGSLFSGGGLGDFGFLMAGMEISWQCEIDEYCQKILELRYPDSNKYRNIKELNGKELKKVDIITGGFPCQPFSVAGKQNGKDDDRNLWPEMFRIIKDVKPRWVICENVPGIIPIYLDTVLFDLEGEGYICWPIVFSSHSLGAWHKRERLWIVCYSKHDGQLATKKRESIEERSGSLSERKKQTSEFKRPSEQYAPMENTRCELHKRSNESEKYSEEIQEGATSTYKQSSSNGGSRIMADTTDSRLERMCGWEINPFKNWWSVESRVGRVANGITHRIHRLKMLGNGQTPCSTYVIGKWIMEYENNKLDTKAN